MEMFLEMRLEFGFPEYVMIYMYMRRVFNGPFPSHKYEIRGKTDNIHYIGTHVEWGTIF